MLLSSIKLITDFFCVSAYASNAMQLEKRVHYLKICCGTIMCSGVSSWNAILSFMKC